MISLSHVVGAVFFEKKKYYCVAPKKKKKQCCRLESVDQKGSQAPQKPSRSLNADKESQLFLTQKKIDIYFFQAKVFF